MTDGGWFVYIVVCNDGTLYTGSTTDVIRRVSEHNSERRGAKYTRSRRPVRLIHSEGPMERTDAFRRENEIKRMSRVGKMSLRNGKRTDMKIFIYRVGASYDSEGGIYWSRQEYLPEEMTAVISQYEAERIAVLKNKEIDLVEKDNRIKSIVSRFLKETGFHRISPIEVDDCREWNFDIPFATWMIEDYSIEV